MQKSYELWRDLLSNWYDLLDTTPFFDQPKGRESINAAVYLRSRGHSIEQELNVIDFVLKFYGTTIRYMGQGNNRRNTDFYCSTNVLLGLKNHNLVHLYHDQAEDLERLLRSYIIDVSQAEARTSQEPTSS